MRNVLRSVITDSILYVRLNMHYLFSFYNTNVINAFLFFSTVEVLALCYLYMPIEVEVLCVTCACQ